jgi:uncharacterized protein YbcI
LCLKWKNVNTEEGRKNYRRLRNELKRATDSAKKEYLENILCKEIMELYMDYILKKQDVTI